MAYGRIVGAEAESGDAKIEAMINEPELKKSRPPRTSSRRSWSGWQVAKECRDDAMCYGKKVLDKKLKLAQREKAGIMIGVLARRPQGAGRPDQGPARARAGAAAVLPGERQAHRQAPRTPS